MRYFLLLEKQVCWTDAQHRKVGTTSKEYVRNNCINIICNCGRQIKSNTHTKAKFKLLASIDIAGTPVKMFERFDKIQVGRLVVAIVYVAKRIRTKRHSPRHPQEK